MAAPALMLVVALALALQLARPALAQQPEAPVKPPVSNNTAVTLNASATQLAVSVAYNNTHLFRVSLDPSVFERASDANSPPTRVLVAHFAAFRPLSDDDLNTAYRHGMPYILLSATSKDGADPPAATPCTREACVCGTDPPYTLPKDTSDSVTDRIAFHAREQAAFIRLPNLAPSASVRLALSNFPAAKTVNNDVQTDPSPTLRGRLVLRLFDAPDAACPLSVPDAPTGAVDASAPCAAHGSCDRGVCACEEDYDGRFCTDAVLQWPPLRGKGNADSYKLPNGVKWSRWKENPDDKDVSYQFNATLPPFTRTWVQWRKAKDKDAIIRVRVHKGMAGTEVSQGVSPFELPRLRVFLRNASYARPQCGDGKSMRPSRITGELTRFTIERLKNRVIPYNCGTLRNAHGSVDALLYADATGYRLTEARSIQVELLIRTSSSNTAGMCVVHRTSYDVPFFLVPMCLAIMAVSATVIIVLLIVDRRHGFTNLVDVLSVNELNRMHPSLVYGSPELPVSAIEPDTSTASLRPECSICLCPFEVNDPVRRLKCAHMYHCDCVDPWLTKERASCPTCRAKARVDELSDRRHLRYLVQLGLWPIMAWRRFRARQRERRSAEGQTADEGEDVGRISSEPGVRNNQVAGDVDNHA